MPSSLWIDAPDAQQKAAAHRGWLGPALSGFVEQGYAIIPNAVPAAAIDRYLAEFEELRRRPSPAKAHWMSDYPPLHGFDLATPLSRALDTFMFAPAALDLMFAGRIGEFLKAIFQDDILAFQTLHFEVGSTQTVHQDTAYVVVDRPLHLAATWIALEDVAEGSGELVYYPGSHRFPHFLYDGRKHWCPDVDDGDIHGRHLASLHEQAAARGIAMTSFRPKKGDALIWHADLAHGGGAITDPKLTRRSLVTHYCPLAATPHYFSHTPHARKIQVGRNAVSSMYYDAEPKLGLRRRLQTLLA